LRVEPLLRKHCNVFIAEDLDVPLRLVVTKRFKRRQSKNEIADRPATNNQNAVHLSCVDTALRAVFIDEIETVCIDRPQVRTPDGFVLRRTGGYRKVPLILRKREPENHAAVNQRDRMETAPAKNTASAPINLIAKNVRNRHPE